MNYIGIDLGTTSICGVVYNVENSTISAIEKVSNDTRIETSFEWEYIQDPEKIYLIVLDILKTLIKDNLEIKGISISTQMHGMLYVNKKGEVVSPFYTWLDNRAAQNIEEGSSYISLLQKLTGESIPAGYALATHFTHLQMKTVPKDAWKISSIGDFVAMGLCGTSKVVMDSTVAHSFGAFDLQAMTFKKEVLKNAGISEEILPALVSSTHKTGDWEGIPVFTSIGDNQAGFLGSVSDLNSMALINLGTSGQISCYSEKLCAVETMDVRPFMGGGYLYVGASICGGRSYALLANFFKETLAWFEVEYTKNIYDKLNEVSLLDVPDPVKVLPFFRGSRSDINKTAEISNISDSNFLPKNLTQGVLNGIVQELYSYFIGLDSELKKGIVKLIGVGNLITENPNMVNVVENIFGRETMLCKHDESGAVGAAINAAVGLGYYSGYNIAGGT